MTSHTESDNGLERRSISTGTIWEKKYGYCRAVRYGVHVLVSGTTATGPSGQVVGQDDPAMQASYVIDKIEKAIVDLGGSLADVRTRIYISNMEHWESVATVHGERFTDICPANTLVEAKLVGEEYLVEIEADAIIGAGHAL
jgi:enamine deaminase RidA (YjgF/YER057c/UK114 family)